ncbi:type I-E CRISPR-associated protein Cse1/CasA [Nitrincola iocasae]|uniref:Type I-E CRISPR-associated protein Cse1/CasA n=1 Tax=Nitrincola iocasae TaxID=2614693 RepID=A0A5J6L9K7_9GAMM|nr:type I-E CRISPR-associated protein Cse1/CasA [Nitrincola iocasae]QEW05304.1 type I-E CRISPR-associated protein Cse1/CasA [Nitrincola iocasae]
MSRFNLIDEKWIPVKFPDGTRDELGIRDTLLRAGEIQSIEDASPLVVAALHRFLLAVLYRALGGPTDIEQAKELFRNGFPANKITSYLDKWRDRFWLFDEKYPFGQNPNVPKKAIEPWTKLTAEYNATSNKVLFDHVDTGNPGTRTPSECSRWLCSGIVNLAI